MARRRLGLGPRRSVDLGARRAPRRPTGRPGRRLRLRPAPPGGGPRRGRRHRRDRGRGRRPSSAAAAARAGDLKVYLVARHGDPGPPWCSAPAPGPRLVQAVYARVPDPAAFLDHVMDELSRRIAAPAFAHRQAELPLSLYEDVLLALDGGGVTRARRDPDPARPVRRGQASASPPTGSRRSPSVGSAPRTSAAPRRRRSVADRALDGGPFPKRPFDVWAPI